MTPKMQKENSGRRFHLLRIKVTSFLCKTDWDDRAWWQQVGFLLLIWQTDFSEGTSPTLAMFLVLYAGGRLH